MKLISFQIKMYKCVLDSGHVSVAPLTVLVGKNESGKTTLLKALHKFNPFKTEPYSIPVEWPRAYRDQRSEDQIVCTAEFMLSPDEQQGLVDLTGSRVRVDTLQIEKDYEGKFEIRFPEDTFSDQLHPNDIDQACAALPSVAEPANAEFIVNTNQCKDEAKRLAEPPRESRRLLGLSHAATAV